MQDSQPADVGRAELTFWQNHHLHVTLVFGLMIFALTAYALYIAWQSKNPTAVIAALPASVTGLVGLHAGSSAVAASPNTTAYGYPPTPPALPIQPSASPPSPIGHL